MRFTSPLLVVAVVAALASPLGAQNPQASSPTHAATTVTPTLAAASNELIGVWQVAHFCVSDSAKNQHVPFPQANGYFVYTPNGHFSLQFGPAPGARTLSSAELAALPLSAKERPTYERGYVAYFGTYTVTSDSTLVHHVAGGTITAYHGTDQRRPYRITGARRDTLAIGDLAPGCRVLVRVE